MVVQPVAQRAQRQSLTTAIKNICREYPAGGTVLRELLQNADDAGATEVRFVLDENTYPSDTLQHPICAKYQGPALLAFNNALFTENDFENISRMGDSSKIDDGSKTGRFGRGFNSVYNWTDSPAILSRDRFCILDPHEEWSEGGPVYDFVEAANDLAIQNHLAAFSAFLTNPKEALEGTIIRVPLRTEEHAKVSKISSRTTTAADIDNVFESFVDEFGHNGLLFMRNVEKLSLSSSRHSMSMEMHERTVIRTHKMKIRDAVKRALRDPNYSFDHSFEATMMYEKSGVSTPTKFMIHHQILGGVKSPELQRWLIEQKTIPWVSIAAKVPMSSSEMGSMFTVLPLPITSGQLVHVHGMFALKPDRASFVFNDSTDQDKCPWRWNQWLLEKAIPSCWTQLLSFLARLLPDKVPFERWPQLVGDSQALSGAADFVLARIEERSLPLWYTRIGYKTSKEGLLATIKLSTELSNALYEAGVPVVSVPQQYLSRCRKIFKDRIFSSQTLCQVLRANSSSMQNLSDTYRLRILEYVLSDSRFNGYGGIEIFPFTDGTFGSVGVGRTAFVARDESEDFLFQLDTTQNIDLKKLSVKCREYLLQECKKKTVHPSIQYRAASSLKSYAMNMVFASIPQEHEMVELTEDQIKFVSNSISWMIDRGIDITDADISCLWLLPLSNQKYRKVKAETTIYIAPKGDVGTLMTNFDKKFSSKKCPLLLTSSSEPHARFLDPLSRKPKVMVDLRIKDASDPPEFLTWLHETSAVGDSASDEERKQVAEAVFSALPRSISVAKKTLIKSQVMGLKIFCCFSGREGANKWKFVKSWTNLSTEGKFIGLSDCESPLPSISGAHFLVARPGQAVHQLLEKLELATCLGFVDVLQDCLVPAWKAGEHQNWGNVCKEEMAMCILKHFGTFSYATQNKIRDIAVVPVSMLDGQDTTKFATASSLVDRDSKDLMQLYFKDEEVLPKQSFFTKHNAVLKVCGLKSTIDEAVVRDRVSCYGSGKYASEDVMNKAKMLLKCNVRWTTPVADWTGSDLRSLSWLPAQSPEKKLVLQSASQCRPREDEILCGSQKLILAVSISKSWVERLGMDTVLPTQVVLSQLKFGLKNNDGKIVNKVLEYIEQNRLSKSLTQDLKRVTCVKASNGFFLPPSLAFIPSTTALQSYDRLQPYISNVEHQFWGDHGVLLRKFGVRDELELSDLLYIQSQIDSKPVLDDADVAVAIGILHWACKFPRDELGQLKVVTTTRQLVPISQVTYDDLGGLKPKGQVHIAHSDIAPNDIRLLEIVGLRDQMIKGMLEIEDDEEDEEFDQREEVTTRIADTLDRYPVESTFREYLANADDATNSSEINWRFDDRTHTLEGLLTPDMKAFQGPALLVHNDAVFSEKDWKGFKNVGEGSKAEDRTTIGQFGRGSQTMYHWTDVPMIVSGKWLLILDPQQHSLPRKGSGKRMRGVKLLLSKVREPCGGQLAPFEGLWEYTRNLDSYPGTIFRFPLRSAAHTSIIGENRKSINGIEIHKLMNDYFDEARISLLFLRKIKKISFDVYGRDTGWAISRNDTLDDGIKSFSQQVVCSVSKHMEPKLEVKGKDKWWVAIEDLEPDHSYLPELSRRKMKAIECGMAALFFTDIENGNLLVKEPSMFAALPLQVASDLPIYIHATFSLSGDRRSIAIDENDIQSHGPKWNRYLLQKELPDLYLSFLETLGGHVRQDVFKFFPQMEPPKRSCAELICASFWTQLPSSGQSLFPKARLNSNQSQRTREKNLLLREAIFDLMKEQDSDTLAPFLLKLGVNLVRGIPGELKRHLQDISKKSQAHIVTGAFLRQLLKKEEAKKYLQENTTTKKALFDMLLKYAVPNAAEYHEFNGCHIIPLEDGSLGTLKYSASDQPQTPDFFLATESEIELFDFAARYLSDLSCWSKSQGWISTGKFNIQRLKIQNAIGLLQWKTTVGVPTDESDQWLKIFWSYWNRSQDASHSSSNLNSSDLPIFRAVRDGTPYYVSPKQYFELPAVVEPCYVSHKAMCDHIPGLYRFDRNFMPRYLTENAKSFQKDKSFHGFIRALKLLAGGRAEITSFIVTNFEQKDLEEIRDLVISRKFTELEPSQYEELIEDLKGVPLWPSFKPNTQNALLAAGSALLAADEQILMPWMKQAESFICPAFASVDRNKQFLNQLRIRQVSRETLLTQYIVPLPAKWNAEDWHGFKRLLETLSEWSQKSILPRVVIQTLKVNAFAPNGFMQFKEPGELFDHEDGTFKAAFTRQEESRMLHKDLRQHRPLWQKLGLRHRNTFTGFFTSTNDYVQCLHELSKRLEGTSFVQDPNLARDSLIVLSPLTTPSAVINPFTDGDWTTIGFIKVFRSKTNLNDETPYRRADMDSVAEGKKCLNLSEIILPEHLDVCWSQTPFPVHQPTAAVLSKFKSKGQPSPSTIWLHLLHLKNLAPRLKLFELSDFLNDLRATYAYLQERLDESKCTFNLYTEPIWLNIESWDHHRLLLENVRADWLGLDSLVLSSSCDAGNLKAVKPGLMQFENLLRRLECTSVIYPTVTRPQIKSAISTMNGLRKMRADSKMVDIKFLTEGKTISAHRIILMSVSSFFMSQFGGDWKKEDIIDYDGFLSYNTIYTMIEFAYEGEVDWQSMEIVESDGAVTRAEKLDLLLDICKGGDFWLMPALKSQAEDKILAAGKLAINLENVESVKESAELANAKEVEKTCEEFILRNRDAVAKAQAASS